MLGKFLILATVALAHGRPSDPETHSFVPSDLCPADQSHWLLPHEYDCTKFYYCEYGQKWETPRDCAPGTEFSFEIQVCVHPAQANCNLPGSPPTEADPTTTTPEPTTTTTTPEPTTTTTTPEPTTTTTTPEPTTTTTTPEPTTTTTTPEPTTTTTTPEPTTTTTTPEPTTTTTTPEPTTTTTTPEPTTTTTTPEPTTTTTTPEPTTTTTTPEPTTTTTTPEPTTTTTTPEPTTTTTTPEPTTTTTTPEPTTSTTTPEPTTSTTTPEPTTTTTTPEPTTTTTTPEPSTTTTTQAPNPDVLPNGCPADFQVHQLLPHANCSKFYYCNFGEKVERECAPGTHFNPVEQVCDWPWNAGCEAAGNEDGDGNDEGGDTLPNGCPVDFEVHQLLPHADCSKFYQCNFGEKVERDCAPGTHFNPAEQVCDWPWNAGCESAGDNGNGDGDNGDGDNGSGDNGNGDGGSGDTLPNGCPADFEVHQLLPHVKCNKFYQCNFGQKVERECAPGTHFNPVEQVCDWPWNAGCESAGDNGNGDGDNGSGDNGSGDNGSGDGDNGSGDNGNGDGDNGDTLPNGCPADFEVHQLLPHANCSKFYQCNFGEKVERQCAPGTHFNPVEQVCDWPWNAGCESAGDNGNGDGDNGSGDNGSGDGDNGSGDNGSGDNGNGDGDNGDTLPNGCPADFEVHQLLPHANCSKFYQCNFGEKVERQCAPGTHFNPVEQVCDWPWNAGCESAGDNGNGDGGNGDGDNGDGDNGDGDSGDGDNGDGDNGDGDNGDGDNGDGDNGDGDNGDGDNGDGDNGDDDNGDGDNGSGDNGNGDGGSGDGGNGDGGNEGTLPNGCPADFDVNQLLPHANCSKFYYCVYGEKVETECAAGTHFNPVEQVCDWPWNAGCDDNYGGNGDGEGGDDNGDGGNEDGGDDGEDNGDGDNGDGDNGDGDNGDGDNGSGDNGNGDGGNGDGGNGDGSGGNDNKCKEECNILPWAHDTDCDKFWRCEGVKAVLIVCSEGLHFNAQTATCDFICNANCERDEIQLTAEANGVNLFVPWDKVDNEIKHVLEKHH